MKILYANRTLYPFEGGADISAFTLLEHLSKKHEVVAVYIGKELENSKIKTYIQNVKEKRGIWRNILYLNRKFENILKKIVEKEKPDLIISQDYLVPVSVKISKKFGIKNIVFLRSYVHISIDGFITYKPEDEKPGRTSNFFYKIQYPFYYKAMKDFKLALKNTDLIILPSYYLRNITFKYHGVNGEVIRPFVSFEKYKVERNGEYITYINPDVHKGVEIFEKIVDRMPDKKFLVAGKKEYKLNKQNVCLVGWTKDMREIYEKTRLLIVPSIWPEGTPRVCIEAMQSGIPFAVSKIGGLIEEAEGCGVLVSNIFDIDEWINAIRKFDDEDFYNKMSKNSSFKALEFDCKRQLAKFNILLNKLLKNSN